MSVPLQVSGGTASRGRWWPVIHRRRTEVNRICAGWEVQSFASGLADVGRGWSPGSDGSGDRGRRRRTHTVVGQRGDSTVLSRAGVTVQVRLCPGSGL